MPSGARHFFGFLVSTVLVGLVLSEISHRLDPLYPEDAASIERLRQSAEHVEALAVGNSMSVALDFRALGLRGFHLWKPGSDPFEIHYQLRAIAPMLPKLKVIFISMSGFRLNNGAVSERHEIRRRYYATTPGFASFIPIDGDVENFIAGKLAPLVRPDHWLGVWEAVATEKNRVVAAVDEYGRIGGPRLHAMSPDDRLTQNVVARVREGRGSRTVMAMEQMNPRIATQTRDVLISIIELMHARGVRVIFYVSPATDLYHGAVPSEQKDFLQAMSRFMLRLVDEYGAEYYDFSRDPTFSGRYELFVDPVHLNDYGAEIFSLRFKRLLTR